MMKATILFLAMCSYCFASAQKEKTFIVKKPSAKKTDQRSICALIINDKRYINNTPIDRIELKNLCNLTVLNLKTGVTTKPTGFTWTVEPSVNSAYYGNTTNCNTAYDISMATRSVVLIIEKLQYSTTGNCDVRMQLQIKD